MSNISMVGSNDIAGFGENVRKIVENDTGKALAYVSFKNGKEWIHFPNLLDISEVSSVLRVIDNAQQQNYR